MDNLNTHHPASLYEAFEPAEARRIAERLEIHYTPQHGSWLNMAEIEIGVMVRQCLDRRIPDQGVLRREVAAWQQQRNRDTIRVDWRFTTADARIKLKSLYPSIQNCSTTREYRQNNLVQIASALIWHIARKDASFLAYRVATAHHCLKSRNEFSTK